MKTFIIFSLLLLSLTHEVFAQTAPDIRWAKCYGGKKNDFPSGITATSDGGYIMIGSTVSSNGDITSTHGNYDVWIVKFAADGTIVWQKTYGGRDEDDGAAIIRSGSGYIVAATTISTDGDLGEVRTDSLHSDI